MPAPILFQVDSFTSERFSGNPAGVCILSEPASESWMQKIAAEMNLSETAFAFKSGASYLLRWFTPTTEVSLCGHATLAAAHILWEQGLEPADLPIAFETLSGVITARKRDALIELDLPAILIEAAAIPADLLSALGLSVPPIFYGTHSNGVSLIHVHDEKTVREMKPNFHALKQIDSVDFIVTARCTTDAECDFVSRVFVPRQGIDEDPVTGSAHCALGPYWKDLLNKDSLEAIQVSARGGKLQIRPRGERVWVGGCAVTGG